MKFAQLTYFTLLCTLMYAPILTRHTTHMHTRAHTHMHTHTHTRVHTHTHTHTHTNKHMHTNTNTCTHIHLNAHRTGIDNEGIYYTHLGAASSPETLREMLETRCSHDTCVNLSLQ